MGGAGTLTYSSRGIPAASRSSSPRPEMVMPDPSRTPASRSRRKYRTAPGRPGTPPAADAPATPTRTSPPSAATPRSPPGPRRLGGQLIQRRRHEHPQPLSGVLIVDHPPSATGIPNSPHIALTCSRTGVRPAATARLVHRGWSGYDHDGDGNDATRSIFAVLPAQRVHRGQRRHDRPPHRRICRRNRGRTLPALRTLRRARVQYHLRTQRSLSGAPSNAIIGTPENTYRLGARSP